MQYFMGLWARICRVRLRTWLVVAVVGIPPAWAVLYSWPTSTHYRLTLDIAVDGVVHSGSGVIEGKWYPALPFLRGLAGGRTGNSEVHGEAVVVDLGDRGLLFVLLTGPQMKAAGSGEMYYDGNPELVLWRADPRKEWVDLPISGLPRLVRFRDIRDPLSVEQVDPMNLAATLGRGVTFERATLAITDAPVTSGITKKLSWLTHLKSNLDGTWLTSSNNLSNNIGKLSFKR